MEMGPERQQQQRTAAIPTWMGAWNASCLEPRYVFIFFNILFIHQPLAYFSKSTTMSSNTSDISGPKFDYDFVVATTHPSINATILNFFSTRKEPTVVVCFVADSKRKPRCYWLQFAQDSRRTHMALIHSLFIFQLAQMLRPTSLSTISSPPDFSLLSKPRLAFLTCRTCRCCHTSSLLAPPCSSIKKDSRYLCVAGV